MRLILTGAMIIFSGSRKILFPIGRNFNRARQEVFYFGLFPFSLWRLHSGSKKLPSHLSLVPRVHRQAKEHREKRAGEVDGND
jgi:hypothetical protein